MSFRKFRARVEVPATYTERGSTYDDWDADPLESWDTRPGYWQPGQPVEENSRGDVQKIAGTFVVQDSRPLPGNARVTILGRQYGVQGDAEDWRSPTGGLDHQRVILESWEVRARG